MVRYGGSAATCKFHIIVAFCNQMQKDKILRDLKPDASETASRCSAIVLRTMRKIIVPLPYTTFYQIIFRNLMVFSYEHMVRI